MRIYKVTTFYQSGQGNSHLRKVLRMHNSINMYCVLIDKEVDKAIMTTASV